MTARRTHLPVLFLGITLLGCDRPDPAGVAAPSFMVGGVGRPSVLVNPNANDRGTAKTIQEGIDMVGEGGTVLVLPGTYAEAIVIGKGLTLESVAGEGGPVVVEPPGAPTTAVAITARAPVVIRGLTVHATGGNGLRRAGGACIFVVVPNDLGDETTADILDNDLDECHPLGRAGAIFVAPAGATNPSATLPVRVTGTVNTVGNTVANSSGSCLTSTA